MTGNSAEVAALRTLYAQLKNAEMGADLFFAAVEEAVEQLRKENERLDVELEQQIGVVAALNTLNERLQQEKRGHQGAIHAAFCAGIHHVVGQRELSSSEFCAARRYVEEQAALAASPAVAASPTWYEREQAWERWQEGSDA